MSLWNKCFFSKTHWPQLTAPFYSVLFETFICQFNSSNVSPIMPDEVITPDTRPETIPSSRITPDPSDSQLHDGASSLQVTSLIFYRVQVRGLAIAEACFVLSDPFLCCFWGLCLDYCTVGRSKHGPL